MHNRTNDKVFRLFAECILVKGAKRTMICDLPRKAYMPIPNDLCEMLESHENHTFEEVVAQFGEENRETITEYFEFLERNEFILWCDRNETDLFPKLNLEWKMPLEATNAIIDLDEHSTHDISLIYAQLETISCTSLQIRIYRKADLAFIKSLVAKAERMRIKSISIICEYSDLDIDELRAIFRTYTRLHSLVFHSSPFEKIVGITDDSNVICIAFVEEHISNESSCGIIDSGYFNVNITLFTEAQKHNSCLNRKISIDVNGEIKNCPSMTKSYGNIKNTSLKEALEKPGFKDLWFINKDQVNVCKDCEFRYICTDCRAYIENPEDVYSKPLKCGYNPYTAEWKDWSSNPLKQQAMAHYGMSSLNGLPCP